MKRLFASLFFLAFAAPLQAQTHYCDTVTPTSGTAETNAPLTMAVCQSGLDANGNPTTITGWALYTQVGAGPVVRTTPALVAGTKSLVSGKTVYTLATTAPAAAGVVTYQWAALNAKGEAVKSVPPFVLTVTLPLTVPAAATNGTLQ